MRGIDMDPQLVITIPAFVAEVIAAAGSVDTDEQRMQLAIALSRANVERGGGPFGAVVFGAQGVVAAGVNRVLDAGFSIAHAEIVALMHAQQALAGLATPPRPLTLVTSTEPCCQCFGAVVWSGIDRLVCGANTDDAEAIGFDEGPKPSSWAQELEKRGIGVTQGVCRAEARAVLEEYTRRGGTIYGLRHPTLTAADG
jgi:tRNA(Arg) A34 adenosine deaminase TadA